MLFSMSPEKKMAGAGYITLNIIRVFNIISLLLVAIASWVMLVMTVKTSKFFLFDGASHFVTSAVACFLVVSECNLFQRYFRKNWPNLSPEAGFVPLGLAMVVLGFNTLGNLNKPATSVENLGLALWRIVIAAGILTTTFGVANIIATFIFSSIREGITGRQVRDHGATTYPKSSSSGSTYTRSSGSVRKPENTVLPTYSRPTSPEERRRSKFGFNLPFRNSTIGKPMQTTNERVSNWDDRSSPVAPEVQRPPTSLHPALSVPEPSYGSRPPPPKSSRYSVVSDMTQFTRF
ncbi:hypothetical protein HYALB_00006009 [Hymenoscyphus albidus]|uniref:DUF7598 domain-containing protein n=1 Tax=Hymenoscyphus albidus TaxID=595503 RepID=A0A9N9LNT0_9HELO|nr:hypothetical protein HYALB_00006009 [Hymenoscyphus albidus]